MPDLSETLRLSASGMRAQADRLRLLSENIANADTPGYRRKLVSFEDTLVQGRSTGAGSNVDLVVEIADTREAQRSYEANLRMFDQARQMTRGLLELLRR
jgi:flagellar basal-body rod protein FlgC